MENNLFASLETSVKDEKESTFYDKMKEMRMRIEKKESQEVALSNEGQGQEAATPAQQQPSLTVYGHEEVLAAATEYFKGDTLAANVWMNKYALKDSDGKLYELTPDDMHRRLASEIARIEKKYPNPVSEEELFEALKDFRYIVPQGSPMAGIGNNFQVSSLSNCFVIGNEGPSDSYGAS